MNIVVREVSARSPASIESRECAPDERMLLLLCRADSALTLAAGMAGVWWTVRGEAVLGTADYGVPLHSRRAYVSDAQRAHEVRVGRGSLLLALLAPPSSWAALLGAPCRMGMRDPALFPALHAVSPAQRRRLLHVVRHASEHGGAEIEAHRIFSAFAVLEDLQRGFAEPMERCPGRSIAQRRNVFLRMQRVRNLLSLSNDPDLDMKQVASAANYSLWRFIRVFATVFGETPYAFVSRCRVDRARGMLAASNAAVGDVAAAVGFETRAALSRAIRRRYGVPASHLRRNAAAAC